MALDVLLIGLGKIGYVYDSNGIDDKHIFTHAKAILKDSRFNLKAVVETDEVRATWFSEETNVRWFGTIEEAGQCHDRYHVVIVATPTDTHLKVIESVTKHQITRCILLEKPIAYSVNEAEMIVKLCKQNDIALFVNYMRRSDVSATKIKEMIERSWLGETIKGVCWYSGDWLNNASHFFNLLEYWLGGYESGELLVKTEKPLGQSLLDVNVKFRFGYVVFLNSTFSKYEHNTIELFSSKGKLSYLDGGFTTFCNGVAQSSYFKEELKLDDVAQVIENRLFRYQGEVLNQIFNFLLRKEYRLCSGAESLTTLNHMKKLAS